MTQLRKVELMLELKFNVVLNNMNRLKDFVNRLESHDVQRARY